MKSRLLLTASTLFLAACSGIGGEVYTVRSIQSHYPHRDSNSETTLIVYENGDSGHTKEILCMFPPDFELDSGLSTPGLDEMKIPAPIRRAREVFSDECNEDYSCAYRILVQENPKLEEGKIRIQQEAENEDNDDVAFMAYRMTRPSEQNEMLERWVLQVAYKGIEDVIYRGEEVPTPELTGIRRVRILGVGHEYVNTTGYLCEKVE